MPTEKEEQEAIEEQLNEVDPPAPSEIARGNVYSEPGEFLEQPIVPPHSV